MRIILTGATGFIGSRLVAQLTRSGHQCVALSRDAQRARAKLPELVAAFDWQPLEGPPAPEALVGADAVVNLLGETVVGRWTAGKKRAIRETRVQGTSHLVAGLRSLETPPGVLISASAVGYYGDRGDDRLLEDAVSGEDFLAGVCRDWEAAAAGVTELGTRLALVRTGLVLHPGGGALEAMLTPFRLGAGGPLGPGSQWWPWIHLHDLLGLLESALTDASWRGPFNATAPNPVRQREFARALGQVLRRPAFLPAPAFALRLALGEFAVELLASRRVEPGVAKSAGFPFAFTDLEQALRDLLAS